ncbi:hypothetical protein GCM10022205_57900 [Spinactinospora alkalitolerans]
MPAELGSHIGPFHQISQVDRRMPPLGAVQRGQDEVGDRDEVTAAAPAGHADDGDRAPFAAHQAPTRYVQAVPTGRRPEESSDAAISA